MNSKQPVPELGLPQMEAWVRSVAGLSRQGVERKTRHLVRYLNLAFFGLRPHKRPVRYGDVPGHTALELHAFASSFTSRELEKGLGGSTGGYKRYIRQF